MTVIPRARIISEFSSEIVNARDTWNYTSVMQVLWKGFQPCTFVTHCRIIMIFGQVKWLCYDRLYFDLPILREKHDHSNYYTWHIGYSIIDIRFRDRRGQREKGIYENESVLFERISANFSICQFARENHGYSNYCYSRISRNPYGISRFDERNEFIINIYITCKK